jgi:Flp pilus assembly pilin Flp
MWIPWLSSRQPKSPPATTEEPSLRDALREVRRRRGATMMEYLVVISLILTVLIITVQHLGQTVQQLFSSDAAATATKKQGGTGS